MGTFKKVKTGITDKNGIDIYSDDNLVLVYENIRLEGYAKLMDDGEWYLYKDKGNYVGILHNQSRISVV